MKAPRCSRILPLPSCVPSRTNNSRFPLHSNRISVNPETPGAEASLWRCENVCGAGLEPRHKHRRMSAALQAAEKLPSFVGRAFRHDIKSAISSGVLTPGGLKAHFSATSKAATHKDSQDLK